MGWISNDNEHEGWAAAAAPDGRLSSSSTGEGMLVKGITGQYKPDRMLPDYEVVPDSEIIGWRGACECGWEGQLWERVTSLPPPTSAVAVTISQPMITRTHQAR